ncbi:MAG: YdcF family protein [Flavobacteriales bacterium]|nr:YdcF family protein [Flavobacteriales bacterium]
MLPTVSILISGLFQRARPLIRLGVFASGALLILMVALAFTRLPFDAHRWLGMAGEECLAPARAIVVLGGSGMSSGPELLRLHRAAQLASDWPHAEVLIVHPGDSAVLLTMCDELKVRGVDSARVGRINAGENTREQALLVADRLKEGNGRIAIVTAPENMRRTVRAFRNAGVQEACPAPAWDHAMFHGFEYDHARIGGKAWAPDMAQHTALRYTFWNYLKLEVTCIREWIAMAYYRLNGWI